MTSDTTAISLSFVDSSTLPLLHCNPKLLWLHLACSLLALHRPAKAVHLLRQLPRPLLVPSSTPPFPTRHLSMFPFLCLLGRTQPLLHRHRLRHHRTLQQLAHLLVRCRLHLLQAMVNQLHRHQAAAMANHHQAHRHPQVATLNHLHHLHHPHRRLGAAMHNPLIHWPIKVAQAS